MSMYYPYSDVEDEVRKNQKVPEDEKFPQDSGKVTPKVTPDESPEFSEERQPES